MDIFLEETYGKSDYSIAAELGVRFKNYRVALHKTQAEVARQCGISVMTLVRFENGKGQSLRLNNLLALLRALQLLERVENLVPDLPESLYKHTEFTPKRVRRKRDEA